MSTATLEYVETRTTDAAHETFDESCISNPYLEGDPS